MVLKPTFQPNMYNELLTRLDKVSRPWAGYSLQSNVELKNMPDF
jgi:hypothetical protein